jgi:Ni,Fe-hydrogenase I cytochrome b subunit
MFRGGNIPQNFKEVYNAYADYIRIYLFCCNRENGTISVNPLEVLDWPYRFFLIMTMIKNEYVAFINKSHEEAMRKAKGNKPRKRRA